MDNNFHVMKYRQKLGNKNILLVQGWFDENKIQEHKILFLLEKEKLQVVCTTQKGIEVRKKHAQDFGVDTEYFFWVKLPLDIEKHRKSFIRVFDIADDSQRLAFTIPVLKILKLQKKVEKYVENEIEYRNGNTIIKGWYASEEKMKIQLQIRDGNLIPYKAETVYRKDVVLEYPEAKEDNIRGFEISCENLKVAKVKMVFRSGDRVSTYICNLHPSKMKKVCESGIVLGKKSVSYLKKYGIGKFIQHAKDKILHKDEVDYNEWMKKHGLSQKELAEQKKAVFEYQPQFSIVVPLYKTPIPYLNQFVQSVKNQTYNNWELCLSDGSGEESPLRKTLRQYVESDSRIKVINAKKVLQISENTNRALELATGDYIVFADHDDLLAPNALYECASVINSNENVEVIYSDEDKVSMDGKTYFQPHFKSDFNIDLLCSMNYICHLFVVNRTIVEKVGVLNPVFDGAQDYDFVLRAVEVAKKVYHIPQVLYHWRAHKESTSENPENKMYAFTAGEKAIQAHYDRVNISAKVHQGEYLGLYRTEHILLQKPLVSVVIPNKDHIDDLDKCIASIEKKDKYMNLEYIVVENNSQNEQTFQYYKKLEEKNEKVRVVYWEGEFNYSAINNYGVSFAKGEYLLFLNNDTEIINGNCIEELLGYCMREDVGVVGARLYYEDDTVQHAGVIVGLGGIAGHAFVGKAVGENGYFSRIICAQDLSAVTAACMMVKKSIYTEVQGFDEMLKVAFNDVDFCMKVRNAGYLIVYNPYAELYHYESKSRGLENTKEKIERFNNEIAIFAKKWPDILENGDPYYNTNLSLYKGDYHLK